MEKITLFKERVNKKEYEVKNNRINRVQATHIKNEMLIALQEVLLTMFDTVERTEEGLIIELSNVEEGTIPFALDVKYKGQDYDLISKRADYVLKQQGKAEKLKAKEKAKTTSQ